MHNLMALNFIKFHKISVEKKLHLLYLSTRKNPLKLWFCVSIGQMHAMDHCVTLLRYQPSWPRAPIACIWPMLA